MLHAIELNKRIIFLKIKCFYFQYIKFVTFIGEIFDGIKFFNLFLIFNTTKNSLN